MIEPKLKLPDPVGLVMNARMLSGISWLSFFIFIIALFFNWVELNLPRLIILILVFVIAVFSAALVSSHK